MPTLGSIRLSAFSKLIGQERETLRTAIRVGRFPVRPWDGEGQRTFTGRDTLAFEIFVALTADGADQEGAAEAVNLSSAPEEFLAALDQGKDVRDLVLIVEVVGEHDPLTGFWEIIGAFTKPAAAIGDYIAGGIAPFRQPGRDADTAPTGLRRATVIPLWPCWELARKRAEAAGYRFAGNDLIPNRADDEADE